MILIIGLGNPGQQYKNTRHNVGFMAVDKFAENNNFPNFTMQKKSNALVSENVVENENVVLVKPQTFMNNSGLAVKKIVTSYKLGHPLGLISCIVVHDDIDLEIGKIKIVKERGSAGHKGVESIIQNIGNNGLIRLRIGIAPQKNIEAKKIVLKKFKPEEKEIISSTITKTAKALNYFIENGLEKTMNEYNK